MKSDLSFNSAKLNLPELIAGAKAGVFACKVAVERRLREIQDTGMTNDVKKQSRDLHFAAKWFAEDAARLEKAANLLYLLVECQERENIQIIKD